jgi:hypothetical protein
MDRARNEADGKPAADALLPDSRVMITAALTGVLITHGGAEFLGERGRARALNDAAGIVQSALRYWAGRAVLDGATALADLRVNLSASLACVLIAGSPTL